MMALAIGFSSSPGWSRVDIHRSSSFGDRLTDNDRLYLIFGTTAEIYGADPFGAMFDKASRPGGRLNNCAILGSTSADVLLQIKTYATARVEKVIERSTMVSNQAGGHDFLDPENLLFLAAPAPGDSIEADSIANRSLCWESISTHCGDFQPTSDCRSPVIASSVLRSIVCHLCRSSLRDVIDYDVRSLVSFTEKARAVGKKPSTELLTFGKLTANEAEQSVRIALNVEGDSLVWEMERVCLADDVPVIVEYRCVVNCHCPKLTKSQAEGSLYRAWTESHGLKIAGANEVIRAVLLTAQESQHLQTTVRSPALEVVSIGFWKTTRRCGGSIRSTAATSTNFTAGSARSRPRRQREVNCDESRHEAAGDGFT